MIRRLAAACLTAAAVTPATPAVATEPPHPYVWYVHIRTTRSWLNKGHSWQNDYQGEGTWYLHVSGRCRYGDKDWTNLGPVGREHYWVKITAHDFDNNDALYWTAWITGHGGEAPVTLNPSIEMDDTTYYVRIRAYGEHGYAPRGDCHTAVTIDNSAKPPH